MYTNPTQSLVISSVDYKDLMYSLVYSHINTKLQKVEQKNNRIAL